jgi:hypothetical protein
MSKNKFYKFPRLTKEQETKDARYASRRAEIEDAGYKGFQSNQTPYKNKKHHTRKQKHKKSLLNNL